MKQREPREARRERQVHAGMAELSTNTEQSSNSARQKKEKRKRDREQGMMSIKRSDHMERECDLRDS